MRTFEDSVKARGKRPGDGTRKGVADREKIAQCVFHAIDELNQMMPEEDWLEKSFTTHLLGESGKLDSLGFINLIVGVEEKIMEEFGVAVSLADEKARSEKEDPFGTIQTLVDYISVLLEEKAAG